MHTYIWISTAEHRTDYGMHLLSDVATKGRNIAFDNKVAKNVAGDIGRLLSPQGARSEGMVPPLSPQIKICGDPIKKAPRKSEGLKIFHPMGEGLLLIPIGAEHT